MSGRKANRRLIRIWVGAASLALFLAPAAGATEDRGSSRASEPAAPARRNVLLLTIDALRPDHLSCYGYSKPTSPNLDRLAAESIVFTDAVSTSAWTSPGILSLLTGLYPSTHGVVSRESSLAPDVATLPSVLGKAGYHVPNLDYLTSIPNYANLGLGPPEKKYFTGENGAELLRWLDKAASSEEPFFVWYHYRFVHLPYTPPPDVAARFLPNGVSIPPDAQQSTGLRAVQKEVIVPHTIGGKTRFDLEADPPRVRALYDGEVFVMDQFLGKVFEELKERGLYDRTIIVVTADHGEELLEHGWVGHASTSISASLYEEVIRIPMIFHFPGGDSRGKRVDRTVSSVDVMPTVLAALGQAAPKGVEGRSTMPLVRGTGEWHDEAAILETNLGGYQTPREKLGVTIKAIRAGGWKLIQKKDGPKEDYELYHLITDPGETKNLIGSGAPQERSLRLRLGDWIQRHTGPGSFVMGKNTSPSNEEEAAKGAACPRIDLPVDGNALNYEREGGVVRARWTGVGDLTYVVEYDVGKGEFHTSGSFPLRGNVHEFGPYPEEVWRSLKSWNPWRVRVVLPGRGDCASPWITLYF